MSKTLVAVTGASSGIGEAFVRRLAPQHDVLLIARRGERLEKLARELGGRYDSRFEVLPADLSDEADVERVAARLESGPNLVLLVNNAGFGTRGRFWESPLEPQIAMHRVHVMATLRLTHAALRSMVPHNHGAIINLASVAAFIRQPGLASYAATKTWIATFTEALYIELKSAGSKVRVQALCPGYTYSEFHDKIGAYRGAIAGEAWWHSAESVVEDSLRGLNRDQLFVIPGWRYRALTAFVSKLPTCLRLPFETNIPRLRPALQSSAGSERAHLPYEGSK